MLFDCFEIFIYFYLFIECWPNCKNHQFDGGKFGRHPFPPQCLLGSPLSSPLFVIFPYMQPAGCVLVKKGENVVAEFFTMQYIFSSPS